VITLALDTCDARGSIALLVGRRIVAENSHPSDDEYSSWLLPAVDRLLASNQISHADLAGYAVASGPGSFTGVRIGLTTVKAWSEVYSKPIVPVSRLAVLAEKAPKEAAFVAAFIDAQRKQIFGALYRRNGEALLRVEEERVIDANEFFLWVAKQAKGEPLTWASLDTAILTSSSFWEARRFKGEQVISVEPPLAAAIGFSAAGLFGKANGTDALTLDANYVRRSDAEIFGKKAAEK
jgi:tRNA threonylcarbamoyladenosine biosynthesis protein TsaB